uniref:Uncharacterized protein n=1 Tax=Poecilia mexicana TaxID=48701 RepID=A0A3B3WNW5_9TELE
SLCKLKQRFPQSEFESKIEWKEMFGRQQFRAQSKPYGLPLRIPVSTRVEIQKLRVSPEEPPYSQKADTPKTKRKPSSVESCSPQLRRAARSSKVTEEPKDSRISSMFPLEQTEHEWLVNCAAGHWTHVHGLLLGDCHLAQKKDFISGFTVLHWAAKCGNSKMLSVVLDMVREGKVTIDINAKSHGGYTPLHIAAQHDQEYIMAMLVGEFGANVRIRDNCGKRPCHYLHKDFHNGFLSEKKWCDFNQERDTSRHSFIQEIHIVEHRNTEPEVLSIDLKEFML